MYDHTDDGNLHLWLHAYAGSVSPLTWGIRMKIIMGIAKGYVTISSNPNSFFSIFHGFYGNKLNFCRLAYLHEDIEPKIIHGDIRSSNIALDQQWNPKIFGFGFANLIGDEGSQVITHVAGIAGTAG